MRVHELAKVLGTSSQKLLDRLQAAGINATNRLSDLHSTDIARFREYESAKRQGKVPATAPVLKPVKEKKEPARKAAEPAKPAPAPVPAAAAPKPVAPKPAAPLKQAPPEKAKPVQPPPAAPVATPVPAPAIVPAAAPAAAPAAEPPVSKPAAPAAPEPKPKAEPAKPATPPVPAEPAKPAAAATPAEKTKRAAAPEPKPEAAKPVAKAPVKPAEPAPPAESAVPTTVQIKPGMTVKELGELLKMRPNQVITDLMLMKVMTSINEKLDAKIATKIAEKHGFIVERDKKVEGPKPVIHKPDEEKAEKPDRPEDLVSRPPIVTVLGHVDHGKTSLLDKIRNTAVAKGEAGGITQHIGASTVIHKDKHITFLDTPGHEAFTAMRARGANMTDIAVLVVAADDGIMPQTKEAIKHAQAAKVTVMVAINKCDLPQANPNRVRQQLAAEGLTPEEWGGTVICCDVSATTGKGVDHLLEMILLQSEILELKASSRRRAHGFVIEARLEPGKGPVANLLVQNGTLHVGDILLCGNFWGRVRALTSDKGDKLKEAGPSIPVQCLGLPGVPEAGADFRVCENDRAARKIAEERAAAAKAESLQQPSRASLDTLFQQIKEDGKAELRLVLKTDTQGSLEAIQYSLREIDSKKVTLSFIMGSVGNITANDVLLASASKAVVFGFHVAIDETVNKIAKQEGVEIRLHSIIYELIDQVREAMTGLLAPTIKETIAGHAEIKQTFTIAKGGVVAGCVITDGYVATKTRVRVKRKGDILYEGSIISLRRFENDVGEVREGQECGIRLDNYAAFTPGDILEFFAVEKIPQTL